MMKLFSETMDEISALKSENKALRKSLAKACDAYLDQLEKDMGREIKSGEMPGWWRTAQKHLTQERGNDR